MQGLAWVHVKREEKKSQLLEELKRVLKRSLEGKRIKEDEVFIERYLGKGNNLLSREDFIRACISLSIEPISLRETWIGKSFPFIIPKRTIKEAWDFILKREIYIKRLFERKEWEWPDDGDVLSLLRKHFFILALYFDHTRGSFFNYMLKSCSHPSREVASWKYLVRVGRSEVELSFKYMKALELANKLGKPELVAKLLKVGNERSEKIKESVERLSLVEEMLPVDDVAGGDDPEYILLNEERIRILKGRIRELISTRLDPRRAFILKLRFGMGLEEREVSFVKEIGKCTAELKVLLDNPTLKNIGDFLGITFERVRQLEAEAISKLRSSDISPELLYDPKPSEKACA